MLTIRNVHTSVDKKIILKGVSLAVKKGEIHAVMGPNGSGKSTLAYALMGHPAYTVTYGSGNKPDGQISVDGVDISSMAADERSRAGLFLAFQQPLAVPGVTVRKFLRHIYLEKNRSDKKNPISARDANIRVDELSEELNIGSDLLKRSLNDDFSGGEKKKIEVLQMSMLEPKYAVVDEIDTGLDVDALKTVAHALSRMAEKGTGILIITHYQRILKYLKPQRVHVMRDGEIVTSGTASLAKSIEEKGYGVINPS